jgi:hypothetical protein
LFDVEEISARHGVVFGLEGSGGRNYALGVENACSLLARMSREFDTRPYLKSDPLGTTA